MMITKRYRIAAFFFVALTIVLFPAVAQRADRLDGKASQFGFIENKGQVIDQQQQPNKDVRYMLMLPGNNVVLRADGFSYNIYSTVKETERETKEETDLPTKGPKNPALRYEFHRVDIKFLGVSPGVQISNSEGSEDVIHYYIGNNAAEQVRHYRKVTYKNIYPGIDIEFLTQRGRGGKPFEYNFVVHPGANIDDIRLQYTGAAGEMLSGDSLVFTLVHGTLTEHIPASYWEKNHTPVDIQYRGIGALEEGVVVGFSSPASPLTETLIIDPEPYLDWATYYGGTGSEMGINTGAAVTIDDNENPIVAGSTTSTASIATSGGSRQTVYGGGVSDGFVAKFDKAGNRLWSAYYGGTGEDYFVDVSVDSDKNIYLLGTTASNNLSTSVPAGQPQNSPVRGTRTESSKDAFVVIFEADGTRRSAFYYGGSGLDEAEAIVTDGVNFFYITGYTSSTNMGSIGRLQPSLVTGGYDAFIGRFQNNGVFEFGTYYGASGHDYGVDIALDHNEGSIYLLGNTRGTTGLATSGAYKTQVTDQGAEAQDIFIRKLSINLYDYTEPGKSWGTYYGGELIDIASAIVIDPLSDDVFICGTTLSEQGIATDPTEITLEAWQRIKRANYDGFILRLDKTGRPKWGTYYGSSGEDKCLALTGGYDDFLYVTGSTTSPDYFATPNSHQTNSTSTYGLGNAYLAKFNASSGQRAWGTFYGGPDVDVAYGIASFRATNTVYIVGATESATGIGKGNVYRSTYTNGNGNDLFLAKFLQSDPCDQWFPDPKVTASVTELFDRHAVVFTAAAHQSGYDYKYSFYYGMGANRTVDIKSTQNASLPPYVFADQGEQYPAVGTHEVVAVMSGPMNCVRTKTFIIRVKPIIPLCETTVLATSVGDVKLDKFSGSYVIQLGKPCAEDIAVGCIYGKVDFPKTPNVVSASATTYSDKWSYNYLNTGPTAGNRYETGEAGKWRAQATYVYNGSTLRVDKNYNSGTFTLPTFVWQRPDAGKKVGWLKTTEITRYSPHGNVVEERNALDVPSTAKYGYGGTMPYLVAKNAEYNDVYFESFEYANGANFLPRLLDDNTLLEEGTLISTTAHAGGRSLQIGQRFSIKPFTDGARLLKKGMLVRVWVKGNNPAASLSLLVGLAATEQPDPIAVKLVARSGEWTLCEATIPPNSIVFPSDDDTFTITLAKTSQETILIDDIRAQPLDSEMTCYVYDFRTLKVLVVLDDQHFGLFYQYNMEGQLVRKMIETERGVKTVQETQYNIPEVSKN